MDGGQLNYTFGVARRPTSEPIMDLIETDARPRCTGPRHDCRGVPARRGESMPLCWLVPRQATEYRTTTNGIPSARSQSRRMRAAQTFVRLKRSRFESTNASSRFENPRTRKYGFSRCSFMFAPPREAQSGGCRTTGLGFSLRPTIRDCSRRAARLERGAASPRTET